MNTNAARLNIEYIKVPSKAENDATSLSQMHFNKICRTCLAQNQINPIFQLNYNGQSFSAVLQSCASIVVN